MQYETKDYKGQLCVVSEWAADWEKPESYRHYWPTGLKTRDWLELCDKPARSFGCHVFEVNVNGRLRQIRLINGGSTKAIFIETRPIKKPKWAVSWLNGEWKRY
jgi:hypothetical protein